MDNLINDDSQMRSLLNTLGTEEPGEGFTERIMGIISQSVEPVARPFRLRKGTLMLYGLIFLASQLLTVVAILNSGKVVAVVPTTDYKSIINNALSAINKLISPEILIIAICLFWLLFLIDSLIKRSKLLRHN
jgi:hypothetical protein